MTARGVRRGDGSKYGGLSVLEIALLVVLSAAVLIFAVALMSKRRQADRFAQPAPEDLSDARGGASGSRSSLWDSPEDAWMAEAGDRSFAGERGGGASAVMGADLPDSDGAPLFLSRPSSIIVGADVKALLGAAVKNGKVDWAALQASFRQVPADSMVQAFAFIQDLPWNPEKDDAMKALIQLWTARDPKAALEFAAGLESQRERRGALHAVTEAWAGSDPEAAYAWYAEEAGKEGQPPPPLDVGLLFEEMYGHNKDWALEEVWKLPSTGLQKWALGSMLHLEGDEPEQTRDRMLQVYAGLEQPEQQALLVPGIVRAWAQVDPAEAAEWLAGLADEELRKEASLDLTRRWCRVDPEQAMEWLDSQEDDGLQKRAGYEIGRAWMEDNPAGFLRWVGEADPSSGRDGAVASYAREQMYKRPEEALALAATMSDPGWKTKVTQEIIEQWMPRNRNAAIIAALESDLPDEIKRKYAGAALPKNVPSKVYKTPTQDKARSSRNETRR